MNYPQPLLEILNKRVILVAGKGGVGRTSLTAALAHMAAIHGKRVLIVEIANAEEDYSPLGQLLGRNQLSEKIETVAAGIRCCALHSRHGQIIFLTSLLRSESLSKVIMSNDGICKIANATPSFREMGIFFHLLSLMKEVSSDGNPEHELILVDMPATGHALALTGLPEILLNLIPRGPIATAIREGQSYLNSAEKTASLVVTLPEALPIAEALELISGLEKTQVPVAGVILNRMPNDPFHANERSLLAPLLEVAKYLGAEEFHRYNECISLQKRLIASLKMPLFLVPESFEVNTFIPSLIKGLKLAA